MQARPFAGRSAASQSRNLLPLAYRGRAGRQADAVLCAVGHHIKRLLRMILRKGLRAFCVCSRPWRRQPYAAHSGSDSVRNARAWPTVIAVDIPRTRSRRAETIYQRRLFKDTF